MNTHRYTHIQTLNQILLYICFILLSGNHYNIHLRLTKNNEQRLLNHVKLQCAVCSNELATSNQTLLFLYRISGTFSSLLWNFFEHSIKGFSLCQMNYKLLFLYFAFVTSYYCTYPLSEIYGK